VGGVVGGSSRILVRSDNVSKIGALLKVVINTVDVARGLIQSLKIWIFDVAQISHWHFLT
jgi:hypothetical protein